MHSQTEPVQAQSQSSYALVDRLNAKLINLWVNNMGLVSSAAAGAAFGDYNHVAFSPGVGEATTVIGGAVGVGSPAINHAANATYVNRARPEVAGGIDGLTRDIGAVEITRNVFAAYASARTMAVFQSPTLFNITESLIAWGLAFGTDRMRDNYARRLQQRSEQR